LLIDTQGTVGVMGFVSRTVKEAGGEITGVIPKALAPREVCANNQADQPST